MRATSRFAATLTLLTIQLGAIAHAEDTADGSAAGDASLIATVLTAPVTLSIAAAMVEMRTRGAVVKAETAGRNGQIRYTISALVDLHVTRLTIDPFDGTVRFVDSTSVAADLKRQRDRRVYRDLRQLNTSMSAAIEVAEFFVDGTALGAITVVKRERLMFTVQVVSAGGVTTNVEVDAATGTVLWMMLESTHDPGIERGRLKSRPFSPRHGLSR